MKNPTHPTMKAIVCTSYGAPEVLQLQEVAMPKPKDNEVLVKVHATTVTSGDARIRRADPFVIRLINGFRRPKTAILGYEFSGEIAATGQAVTTFQVGDPVFGSTGLGLGANAEYVCLPEEGVIAPKPDNLSYAEAAAIPFGGGASLFFLRDKAGIQRGQKVLINGASGSLGVAAVQLAKYFGAEVTGVCSARNAGLVRSLGADHVIDYSTTDFTRGDETYDLIFDTIGKAPFSRSKEALRPNGIFVTANANGSDYGYMLRQALTGSLLGRKSGQKVIGGMAPESREDLLFLKDLVEAGQLKAVIDREYPLAETSEAHRYVDKGHKKGNVVISVAKAETTAGATG